MEAKVATVVPAPPLVVVRKTREQFANSNWQLAPRIKDKAANFANEHESETN